MVATAPGPTGTPKPIIRVAVGFMGEVQASLSPPVRGVR